MIFLAGILFFDAAKQNHIPFIYAKYGFGYVEEAAFIINDFEQITNVLENIA